MQDASLMMSRGRKISSLGAQLWNPWQGRSSYTCFRKLSHLNFKLHYITSLAILSACARGGLAMEGLEICNFLVKNHAVMPTVEICSCMVDMLGRAGQLHHALDFINSMTIAPSPSIWGALW